MPVRQTPAMLGMRGILKETRSLPDREVRVFSSYASAMANIRITRPKFRAQLDRARVWSRN
jgi:hypothetical protein